MSSIIPDWEWRTFGKEIPVITVLNGLKKALRITSSETYIVSAIVEDYIRIQDGILNTESLNQVNRNGFKQWKSEIKFRFPIGIEEMMDVYKIFKLSMPDINKKACGQEEFLQLAGENRRLIIAEIRKSTNLYNIENCMFEKTSLQINDKEYITLAIKGSDSNLLKKVLKNLGMKNSENISYTKAIKLSEAGLLS